MVKNYSNGQVPDNDSIMYENTPESGEFIEVNNMADGDSMTDEGLENSDNSAEVSASHEAEEWKDKYLRLQAEFDNYRKRTLREKMELISIGGEDVIKSLLPVLDDMERALDALNKTEDVASVRTGIELVSKKLNDALHSQGLSEILPLGSELDTDFHEAIAKIPADKKRRGKIVEVVQKGYKLNNKVVRHAKCVVGE